VDILAETYTTIQGETWDQIAYKVYGREKYADFLMSNNYPLLDILVFPAGMVLNTPELPERNKDELPSWRRRGKISTGLDPYDNYNGRRGQR